MASLNSLSVPQFPARDSPQRLGGKVAEPGRAKVPLKPGRSLMDWVRLGQRSGPALNGLRGNQMPVVTMEELAKHNKRDDAWTVLRGRVYNITPYMEYHPGGADELLKAAGIDGTDLFNNIHQWVNFESMLSKCYIGSLKNSFSVPTKAPPNSKPKVLTSSSSEPKQPEIEKYEGKPRARYDWYQNASSVIITVYAKCQMLTPNCIIIDKTSQDFKAKVYLDDHIYFLHLELNQTVTSDYKIQVRKGSVHRLEIVLQKMESGKHWQGLGKQMEGHGSIMEAKEKELTFRSCKVKKVETVTHDTKLLTFELPEGSWMSPPIGYHVYLKATVNGTEVNRPYTVVEPTIIGEPMNNTQLHLMIKIYKDGLLTPTVDALKEGDVIDISDYEGSFVESRLNTCQDLVLLAAGSGFTPMIRLIHTSIASNSNRKVKLLFFNKTEKDILWKQELEILSEKDKRLEVAHILSNPDSTWKGLTGRIRNEVLKEQLNNQPGTAKTQLICVCGPTPFTRTALTVVKQFGYSMESLHLFTA
ncbi:cytochrome b5 reductase 4-like [Antedon mediterranea]|uniref:cytochrome b5 reductase 4-like n=1 Tax=Antedon mediterranea TaxID=105859 RepID=UPI003AF82193